EGYESDAAIVEALRTEPNVAVIDSFAVTSEGDLGRDESIFTVSGITTEDTTFAPFTVEIADPASDQPATVPRIGVIDSKVSILSGLHVSRETAEAVFPAPYPPSWWVSLENPDTANTVARDIEAVLLQYGGQAVSIQDQLEDSQ